MSENPSDLQYTKDHEWARVDGSRVKVGITRHAVEQLGDVTLVNLDARVGARLTAGKAFGTVESVKAVSDLFAPVSGKLVEANGDLANAPEVLNEDPYSKGWMVVIELDAGAKVEGLMSAAEYDKYLGSL